VGVVVAGSICGWLESAGVGLLIFALAFAIVAAVSLVDDLRNLSWKTRLLAHVLCAAMLIPGLYWPGLIGLPTFVALLVGLLILTFLAGYANAFNFMDGINGLAASQAVITGAGEVVIAIRAGVPESHPALIAALLISGSAAGFLPHNFPRPRMFMGDVGSVSLGFGLAALAVWISSTFGWWLLLPFGVLQANFILDTGITVARRALRGRPLHQAHREHFYQRLIRSGRSHSTVTLSEVGLQLVVVGIMGAVVSKGKALVVCAGIVVVALWTAFFLYCEITFRRHEGRSDGIV
jgi:UDP-N-acetylmuramyl pentapeptide phosphotransferase/UDP-N-acetylglucosamine-1-phosphate transferase